jgi:hypothetical protein
LSHEANPDAFLFKATKASRIAKKELSKVIRDVKK